MTVNYHTHTVRCRHASGSEREYIETAISRGLTILGFSDHSPYVFEGIITRVFAETGGAWDYCETPAACVRSTGAKLKLKSGLNILSEVF